MSYRIDFSKPDKIHFIGIGGISMSGLAEILLGAGFTVSGSDRAASDLTRKLESEGCTIYCGQRSENIKDDTGIVVYTAAIKEDNPELAAAISKGIPTMTRAELLGQIMKNYETSIAVSGTHGKTTTTSMLTSILLDAETDPTVSVGGMLPSIGGNIRIGKSGFFVTEACEYTNSFLSFFPTISIILNIDADHLDFFKDIDDIRSSFKKFADLLPENGLLVINSDIDRYEEITKDVKCRVVTVSAEGKADYTAHSVEYDDKGCASFEVVRDGSTLTDVSLAVPGAHNVSNALAAIAVCDHLKIGAGHIKNGIGSYTGTDRRFQYKGKIGGVTVIDDYAHHPTEIAATLSAAKNVPHKKLWLVFQPHTYSRTKALFDEFAKALSAADEVVLADIYAARENDDLGISSKDLCEAIKSYGTLSGYFGSFDEIENFLLQKCSPGDLLITMGAGDIVKVADDLVGS
ncbi:MAG: UDP-N-acetylmuramate--L-alanine ligase [Lachnospiraceae bacterium]|nr:UDP-N-acetylmuramate--L-alanine ligase [Lachnospiraceae bacterium]